MDDPKLRQVAVLRALDSIALSGNPANIQDTSQGFVYYPIFSMSTSQLESAADKSSESSDSSPLNKRARHDQVSETECVFAQNLSNKARCQVSGCKSQGVYPLRHDRVLACKAHKKKCSETGCTAAPTEYSALCESHVRARLPMCGIRGCPNMAGIRRICLPHADIVEGNLPGNCPILNSLKKTGQRPVWVYGNFKDDVITRYEFLTGSVADIIGDGSGKRLQELHNHFTFGEGRETIRKLEDEVYIKYLDEVIKVAPPLKPISLSDAIDGVLEKTFAILNSHGGGDSSDNPAQSRRRSG